MAAIQAIDATSTGNTSAAAQALAQKVSGGGKSGGGGAGKAQSTSSSSSSTETTTTYDKMDLNKDGTVTASEKALYYKTHPDEVVASANNNYTIQGTQDEYEGGFSGILNLSA